MKYPLHTYILTPASAWKYPPGSSERRWTIFMHWVVVITIQSIRYILRKENHRGTST